MAKAKATAAGKPDGSQGRKGRGGLPVRLALSVAVLGLMLGVFVPGTPLHDACFPDKESEPAATEALCAVDFGMQDTAPTTLVLTPGPGDPPCPYAFGLYRRPVLDPHFHPLTPFQRLFQLKHWHWHSVAAPPFLVGAAVADFGFAGAAFAYVLDTRSGRIFQREFKLPLHMGVSMAPSASQGCTSFAWPWATDTPIIAMCFDQAREAYRLVIDMTLNDNVHLAVDVLTGTRVGQVPPAGDSSDPADSGVPSSYANNPGQEKLETITLLYPLGPSRPAYTTKLGGLPSAGAITLTNYPSGDQGERRETLRIPVEPQTASASVDWTRALHRRLTVWRWISLSFVDARGSHIGVQLSEGVYAGPGRETGIWVDGRLFPLAFHAQASVGSLTQEWTVKTLDHPASVELTFKQLGAQRSYVQTGVYDCDLNHTIGLFSGTLRVNGSEYTVVSQPGVFEDHVALW